MITIPTPSMALNSPDVFGYSMSNTRVVASDVTPYWLANNVAAVAVGSGGKLAALIFQCHGFVNNGVFAGLDMGTGIDYSDLRHFSQLKNLVDTIYIGACRAASGSHGKRFCGELARRTQAIVSAADRDQQTFGGDLQAALRGGVIDDFEGQVFKFDKSGHPQPVSL